MTRVELFLHVKHQSHSLLSFNERINKPVDTIASAFVKRKGRELVK